MSAHTAEATPARTFALQTIVTDGFVIALATAFAYLATFIYEVGYCSNFGIPSPLISPNTSTILVTIAAVGWIFVSSANLLGFTTPLFRAAKKRGNPTWTLVGAFVVIIIISHRIYQFSIREFLQVLGFIAALLVAVIVLSMLSALIVTLWKARKKQKQQPSANTEADVEVEIKEVTSFGIDEFLENWIPAKIVRVFMMMIGVLLLAWSIGDGNAKTQKRFLTEKDSPSSVVLRIYGDLMITATFNRETKEVSDNLSLIWISEKKQMNFVNEEVGPLKLKK